MTANAVGRRKPLRRRLQRDFRIERRKPFRRDLCLGPADVLGREQDLALKVGELDHIVVDDAHAAHAGRDDVVQDRRPEPTGANDQHGALAQLVLAALADVLEHELAVVPQALA